MGGFSTIGGGTGGGGASQVNYSITASTSQTVSALYLANSLVDVAGLLVSIQNTSGAAITLTAAAGAFVNYQSFSTVSTATTVTIQPNQTLVLETNLANLDYFIVSCSTINDVAGGVAGQLLWQQSPNNTGFIPAGAAGQMLVCGGTSIPTWQPIAVPNVQGGVAGEVLYQTATSATGFVLPGTTGQYLISNGTGAPSWMTIAGGSGTTVTTAGSTTNIKSVRSYTFGTASMTSGQSFVTFLSNGGIPDADGNMYTIYNETTSTFTLVLPVIVNYKSWNYGNGYFISGSNVYIQPNESVNIQTFSASSSQYTLMSTSQSQAWGFNAQVNSEGSLPNGTDTLMNFVATTDNTGAFNNSTHAFVVPKKGLWFFAAQNAFASSGITYACNIQIRQNNNTQSIGIFNSANQSGNPIYMRTATGIFCNIGDQITVTNYINAGSITVNTGTTTQFSGVLVK